MALKRIQLLVNGVYYETLESTLQRFPDTLLGSAHARRQLLSSDQSTTKATEDTLIIRCNTLTFDAILFYYQSNGILQRPPELSAKYFEEQCRYFALDENDIQRMKEREGAIIEKAEPTEQFFSFNAQRRIWEFINDPRSSSPATVYTVFNCILILTSIVIACLQTLPDVTSYQNSKRLLFAIDFTLNCIFLVEYILYFLSCPDKLQFGFSLLNVIDFFAILPNFVFQMLTLFQLRTFTWLEAMSTLRVLRLIRLGQLSTRIQFVFRILSKCLVDIVAMVFTVVVSSVFYASIMYDAEQSDAESTQFQSIPHALWWAIQTVIPVGYGDIVPITVLGKATAGITCVFAALSFTVPVFSLGGNCEIIQDHKTGDSLCYGFIEFDKVEDCEKAYFKMDNVLIDDRRIHVNFCQSIAKHKWSKSGLQSKYSFAGKDAGRQPLEDKTSSTGTKYSLKNKAKKEQYDMLFDEDVKSKEKHRNKKEKKRSKSKRHDSHDDDDDDDDRESGRMRKHRDESYGRYSKSERRESSRKDDRRSSKKKKRERSYSSRSEESSDEEEMRYRKKYKHKEKSRYR
eukprot:gene557-1214_t